jgi:CDP-diacylglycerol--glycerol-3-phosphate 3-phosphatidyltransferase
LNIAERSRPGIASWLTLSRIVLAPVVILSVFRLSYYGWLAAAAATTLAGATDVLDGYLARLLKQATFKGARLDLVADKIFVLCSMAVLAWSAAIPAWTFFVIVARELLVSLMRWSSRGSERLAPHSWAKAKTVTTFVAIACVMLARASKEAGGQTGFFNLQPFSFVISHALWLLALAVMLALVSGAMYFVEWHTLRRNAGKASNVEESFSIRSRS